MVVKKLALIRGCNAKSGMAYEFELESDFSNLPSEVQPGIHLIEFALGYDVDTDLVIVMFVVLVTGVSYLDEAIEGVYDLKFGIRGRKLGDIDDVSSPEFSIDGVRHFIPKDKRTEVLECVLRAVAGLIESVEPNDLTMVTFHTNLSGGTGEIPQNL